MTLFYRTMAFGVLTMCLSAPAVLAADTDAMVYIVEADKDGKVAFPKKVPAGSVVRFHQSCPFNGGDIKVTATNGAKVKSGRYIRIENGQVLRTGTKDMEFEVTVPKKGTKITVSVKNGDKTDSNEFEIGTE